MSVYQIEIDDSKIIEQIKNIINTVFNDEIQYKYSNTGYEITAAVKEIVYQHKDEIIDKVVEKATKEIVRKGLPKLLEGFKNE